MKYCGLDFIHQTIKEEKMIFINCVNFIYNYLIVPVVWMLLLFSTFCFLELVYERLSIRYYQNKIEKLLERTEAIKLKSQKRKQKLTKILVCWMSLQRKEKKLSHIKHYRKIVFEIMKLYKHELEKA